MKIIPTQDLTAKIKENEEEIAQLRKHLADYSLKVAFFFFYKWKVLHFCCLSPYYLVPDYIISLTASTDTR